MAQDDHSRIKLAYPIGWARSYVEVVEPTDLRNDYYYINVYVNGLYLVIMYIVPFGCLAVFNLLIYLEVSTIDYSRSTFA